MELKTISAPTELPRFFLRAKAFGISFYYKSFNNLADAFLVWGTGVLLVWVLKPLQVPAGMLRNLTVLRTFRLLRVARVVRILRLPHSGLGEGAGGVGLVAGLMDDWTGPR